MKKITNIYCVGKNYSEHVKEFDSVAPKSPMFFMKPTHAALFLQENNQVTLPMDQGSVHYEGEIVVYVKQAYQENMPLEDVVAEVGMGLDFTLRDVQWEAKKSGNPWLSSKGFKHSAPLTETVPFESEDWFNHLNFSLEKNSQTVQKGTPQQMIFPLRELLRSCEEQFGLAEGDIIFTGTPAGVGPVKPGDKLTLNLEGILSQEVVID